MIWQCTVVAYLYAVANQRKWLLEVIITVWNTHSKTQTGPENYGPGPSCRTAGEYRGHLLFASNTEKMIPINAPEPNTYNIAPHSYLFWLMYRKYICLILTQEYLQISDPRALVTQESLRNESEICSFRYAIRSVQFSCYILMSWCEVMNSPVHLLRWLMTTGRGQMSIGCLKIKLQELMETRIILSNPSQSRNPQKSTKWRDDAY